MAAARAPLLRPADRPHTPPRSEVLRETAEPVMRGRSFTRFEFFLHQAICRLAVEASFDLACDLAHDRTGRGCAGRNRVTDQGAHMVFAELLRQIGRQLEDRKSV